VKLNSISIGGGLALVAVGLLANAAASLVGSPDRTANADDLKRAVKQPQPIADVAVSSAVEGGAEMVAGSECPSQFPSQHWFSSIWRVGSCPNQQPFRFGSAPLESADVNADGVLETFSYGVGTIIDHDGSIPDACLFWLDTTSVEDEGVSLERTCVLSSQEVADWLVAQASATPTWAWHDVSGWSDVDGDGDLDLNFAIQYGWAGGQFPALRVVLENTGFEKQTYAAGDINHDGKVDGVDISILLSEWSY
jgi:hypothetical protein